MLQITRTSDQSIERQRYFYGTTLLDDQRATNARGISVWAAENRADTRIAICGETYDEMLPLSQGSPASASSLAPTGYVAVLDGFGTLLWTYHFYGSDPLQSCAITDVSIRVDAEDGDIVTYCGISSHGVPALATPLSPLNEYAALPGESGGATDQGPGQWDGIVGRITRTTGAPVRKFHAIVGGPDQDGLLGIAELEADRFLVVGGTIREDALPPPTGTAFPGLGGLLGPYQVGVALVFDGALVRESTTRLGSTGEVWTLARDVHVMRDQMPAVAGTTPVPRNMVSIVGSTSDPALFASLPSVPVPQVLQGPTDGFLWVAVDLPGYAPAGGQPQLWSRAGVYHGGPENDGLTGVQGWSEYPDHLVVTGFTEGFPGTAFGPTFALLDIGVESYFVSAWIPGTPNDVEIHSLRRARIGSGGLDRPASMGVRNATTGSFKTGPLGEPAGGGIAVDERSRVNLVGSTNAISYYVLGGRPHDAAQDAVRTVIDMIPPLVGRTDGTGDQGSFPNAPFVLPVGFTGGTTPACALSRFGKRIGEPAPVVPRILLEYEGLQPAVNVSGTLIVSRPVSSGVLPSPDLGFAAFQFDIPGTTMGAPSPVQLPGGQELFITNATGVAGLVGVIAPNEPLVVPLFPFPAPPAGYTSVVTVQVGCWLPAGIPGGIGSPCPGITDQAYSPAMWFQY